MRIMFLVLCISLSLVNTAQITCTASESGSKGNAYQVIESAGFEIETPDCSHPSFGPHITQDYDSILNKNVFVFHSHIDEDNDRCIYHDRVRIEIKGGLSSPAGLQHVKNSTSYYSWKFKLPTDFSGSTNYCHIFQNKAYGGDDTGNPILTITIKEDVLQIIHHGGATENSFEVLKEVELDPLKGNWIEANVTQVHSDSGIVEITLKDIVSRRLLCTYFSNYIDLWPSSHEFNRPKWGIYRKKTPELKDEQIRFADFFITEDNPSPSFRVMIPPKI